MDLNKTADVVLDTRTPPKVKLQQKQKETIENSHAGIAEPIDEDSIILEETTTKKVNFYKIEKPTTTSGLSTWILLSGQTSPSPPKTTKRIDSNLDLTVVTEAPNRIMKPIFKKRVTTTTRKPQTTTNDNFTVTSTATPPANITKLNKIKASILNNAKKTTSTSTTTTTTESSPTTILIKIDTTNAPNKKNATFNETADMNTIDSNNLPLEAKDGETELSTVTTTTAKPKKTRRPTTKRKKNGNRKRKPSSKNSNSTEVSKPSNKEDGLGLGPMYTYLKKQVMPAVEAGLVGLVVTAGLGLAGYFLYPFGAARRTYDIDRKDKGSYYYTDDYYSGGIAEEEAIGKVIAGMQVNNYEDPYRKYPKSTYSNNIQYKQPTNMERISPSRNYNNEKDVIEQNKETSYSVDDKQFVVGNMPKEIYPEVTPVTVPEHGPRRRRQVDDMENEIFSEDLSNKTETTTVNPTTIKPLETDPTTTRKPPHEIAPHKSFLNLLSDLFQMKISLGLQLLHNATESVARYLVRVQKRVDDHYKENNRTFSCL